MKSKRTLIGIVVLFLAFGLGFVAARERPKQDKQQILMADHNIGEVANSPTEQTFPKNWGRLVNYVVDETNRKLFVFEAEDGTIRAVRTRLDWNNHRIASTEVVTIERK